MEGRVRPEYSREKILSILSKAADILTLPYVIHEILDVTSGKNSSASDLTEIIESDPALTVRILSVANSPYYGFVKKISTISHAVVVLGFQEIQNIALSMSVIQMFDRKGSEFTEKLWRHSFAVGVTTRMMANCLNCRMDGKYFVGGLLHDVGKIFLSQYLTERFTEMLSVMEGKDNIRSYHALEDEYFGISHAEIGGRLLESWMFPQEICDAVAFHHNPSGVGDDPVFAAFVHIADILCTVKGISPLKEDYFLTIQKSILPVLQGLKDNLSTDDLVNLIPQIDLEIDRHSNFVSAFKH
ncbi:MAG TPA: HDOD domain-containing protein [Deltaproteobacteria bacterium]|nr:HDOD domain-containing protein [Deltaproteobacteria bacterium]